MFAIKLSIFVTLFLLTKQEQYWKYFSPDEFSRNNNSMSLDLKQFTKYEQLSEFDQNLHCLTFYYTGIIEFVGQFKKCSSNKTFTFSHLPVSSRSCSLSGNIKKVEILKNSDDEDSLIFISLEGCHLKNATNSPVTLIMTNNVEIDYETLKSNYDWTRVSFGNLVNCNILCSNVVLERRMVNLKTSSITRDEFWNFLTFDEFRTRNPSATIDMKRFKKYEHFKSSKVNLNCLISFGEEKYNLLGQSKQCCTNELSDKNKQQGNETICPLHGEVETVQFLRNRDAEDSLIFISIEGCYTVDEFGNKLNGTFLMTNNITTSYEAYKADYRWTEIGFSGFNNCNLLCTNIALDRCMNPNSKFKLMSPIIITHTLRYAVLTFEENTMDFCHMKIIIMTLSIVFVTIFLTVLVFKLINAKKIEDVGKF